MDTTPHAPTRRAILRSGGLGLAGAAVLAACGTGTDSRPGLSGGVIASTTAPPPVPSTEPSLAARQLDTTVLRTGNSLELVVADAYRTYGPKLTDPELAAAAERIAADHDAAAEEFAEAVPEEYETGTPNERIQATMIDPLRNDLTSDAAISNLLAALERTLTATYITAVGTLTTAEWRQRIMEFGAASARRAALFANGGAGGITGPALFPLTDLIPNAAYLSPENDAAATTTTEG